MLAPRAGLLLGPVGALLALDLGVLLWRGLARGLPELAVAVVLGAVLAFLLVFYRDPERPVGAGIVSAADGRVRAVEKVGDRWNISVFMNVTNVHVNRMPLDATVEGTEAAGRGYRPAFRPDAAGNVQRRYRLSTEVGPVEVVQITGIVARRLVPFVRPGASYRKGDRLGMIVLGSRVDVIFPAERTAPSVVVGDRVWAGSSTIAKVVS